MVRYLLDTNAVIPFQRAGCLKALVAAAKSVPMAMVVDRLAPTGEAVAPHAVFRAPEVQALDADREPMEHRRGQGWLCDPLRGAIGLPGQVRRPDRGLAFYCCER